MLKNLQRYYLDNNASTQCDPRISDLYQEVMSSFSLGNPHSSEHSWGWKAEELIHESSEIISQHYNALADEVIYTSGATEANNMALIGLAQTNFVENLGKKKIIVSEIEHKCVLNAAFHASKLYNLEMIVCPVKENGRVDVEFLEKEIDQETLVVSIMAVNNEMGMEQPIRDIGRLTKDHGTIFHVDAAQASYFPIDMVDDNIDLLSLSGHKMYAPIGIGALLVSEDLPINLTPIIHGGEQQKGLRSGTLSPGLCRSLAEAIAILSSEGSDEKIKIKKHRSDFIAALESAEVRFELNGELDNRHPGNLNIFFDGIESSVLINNLQPRIALSTGSACNSGVITPSYVLKAMGFSDERIQSSVRMCFGRFNLEDSPIECVDLIRRHLDK